MEYICLVCKDPITDVNNVDWQKERERRHHIFNMGFAKAMESARERLYEEIKEEVIHDIINNVNVELKSLLRGALR